MKHALVIFCVVCTLYLIVTCVQGDYFAGFGAAATWTLFLTYQATQKLRKQTRDRKN